MASWVYHGCMIVIPRIHPCLQLEFTTVVVSTLHLSCGLFFFSFSHHCIFPITSIFIAFFFGRYWSDEYLSREVRNCHSQLSLRVRESSRARGSGTGIASRSAGLYRGRPRRLYPHPQLCPRCPFLVGVRLVCFSVVHQYWPRRRMPSGGNVRFRRPRGVQRPYLLDGTTMGPHRWIPMGEGQGEEVSAVVGASH